MTGSRCRCRSYQADHRAAGETAEYSSDYADRHTSHELNDGYSTVITVDKEADSVDFALMNILPKKSIYH